jgi:hypothetical protein
MVITSKKVARPAREKEQELADLAWGCRDERQKGSEARSRGLPARAAGTDAEESAMRPLAIPLAQDPAAFVLVVYGFPLTP